MTDLKVRVAEALRTAVYENGYENLLYEPPEVVAVDVGTYCSDLEGEDPNVLVSLIQEWQEHQSQ